MLDLIYLNESGTANSTSTSILSDSTLICAFPSDGSIPQLCMDSIIASLISVNRLDRIATIESNYLIPMAGIDSFHPSGNNNSSNSSGNSIISSLTVCLPIEIYRVRSSSVYLLIQRSNCFPNTHKVYSKDLLSLFTNQLKVKNLIVLSSASSIGNAAVEPSISQLNFVIGNESIVPSSLLSSSSSIVASHDVNTAALSFPINAFQSNSIGSQYSNGDSGSDEAYDSSRLDDDFNYFMHSYNNGIAAANASIDVPTGMGIAQFIVEEYNSMKITSGVGMTTDVCVLGKFCTGEGISNIHDGLRFATMILHSSLFSDGISIDAASMKVTHPQSWSALLGPKLNNFNSAHLY